MKAKSMSQVSMIFACGTALFSDGYANGVIGSVNILLSRIYGSSRVGKHDYSTTLSSLAFAGTIVGMLTFGYLSDKVGRKFGMMLATGIVAFFSLLSAASEGAGHNLGGTLAMLSACRFLLGIGVGAEYPCGSVAASEQSEEAGVSKRMQHGYVVLATNTMIDIGFVIAAFVPLVLVWIFGEHHLRAVWRLSLGLGFIPAVLVFLWRLRMTEPAHYKQNSMHKTRIPYWLVIKRYWRGLLGLSVAWFVYDFITYPFGLYNPTIISNITGGSSALTIVFGWSVVTNLFYIPGTFLGAFLVDPFGPKAVMIFGLIMQAIIGFIMSGAYHHLTNHIGAFAVVYGIFLSFGEVGPGDCLGLLAAKSGPTAVRGQYYGTAAAIGKVGAFVGTWAFPPMIKAFGGADTAKGNTGPFWVGSGLALFSALVTLILIRPLDHDGMIAEDRAFREYLEANGFDTSQMGTGEVVTQDSYESGSVSEKEMHGSPVTADV